MKTAPKDFRNQRVFVDTNIFLDFFEDRHAASTRFFFETIRCRFSIVVSSAILNEYKQFLSLESFMVLDMLDKFHCEAITLEDRSLARSLPTHYGDALHAAVAIRLGIPLITHNTKDFAHLDLIVYAPEDIC